MKEIQLRGGFQGIDVDAKFVRNKKKRTPKN
jgi:hypothetical protein